MQTKLQSIAESLLQVGIGFFISWATWVWVAAPLFNIGTDYVDSLGIVCLFTVTSLVRQYLLRRFGNKWIHDRFST